MHKQQSLREETHKAKANSRYKGKLCIIYQLIVKSMYKPDDDVLVCEHARGSSKGH